MEKRSGQVPPQRTTLILARWGLGGAADSLTLLAVSHGVRTIAVQEGGEDQESGTRTHASVRSEVT